MSVASFHPDLRAGVRTRLQALSGLPAVAWEGKNYVPVKGTPWISESVRPVSSQVTATGLGGTIAHTVMATMTLYYPANAGTLAIETMAGQLMEHFRPGTAISYGSATAVVQQAERAGLQQEADWVSETVVITMVGHTSN